MRRVQCLRVALSSGGILAGQTEPALLRPGLQARPTVSSPHNLTHKDARCPEGEALAWALQERDQEDHLGLLSQSGQPGVDQTKIKGVLSKDQQRGTHPA